MSNLGQLSKRIEKDFGFSPAKISIKAGAGRSVYWSHTKSIEVHCGGYCVQEQAMILLHEYRHFMQDCVGTFPTQEQLMKVHTLTPYEFYNQPWEYDANMFALREGKRLGYISPDWYPVWWKEMYGEVN
jgi:hypothetical protein